MDYISTTKAIRGKVKDLFGPLTNFIVEFDDVNYNCKVQVKKSQRCIHLNEIFLADFEG